MNCCGKHIHKLAVKGADAAPQSVGSTREERTIKPYEQCIFCAEKHVSDAWDLSRECGYETPNRQTIIGALGSAERHLFVLWRSLAERVRSARHLVQLRRETDIEWGALLAEIDRIAAAAAANIKKESRG